MGRLDDARAIRRSIDFGRRAVQKLLGDDAVGHRHQRAVQRGEPAREWQTKLNRKDGSHVEVLVTASAARDAEGKVVGVSVVARALLPVEPFGQHALEMRRD